LGTALFPGSPCKKGGGRAVAPARDRFPGRIGCIGSEGLPVESRPFAELLIDCEEDRVLRAILVGMLRESEGR
jgi:hypothetical protein